MYEQFHQYLKVLKYERKLSPNSYQSYERDLKKFIGYLEEQGVTEWNRVHKHHVMKYINMLKDAELKSATIARHIVSIRALFHFLLLEDHITFDPSIYIEAPKQSKQQPKTITQETAKALLNSPDVTTASGLRDKAMLELLYATGIRVSELVALNVEHIHLSLGFIQCISPSGKERFVPFGSYARDALESYLNTGREQLTTERTSDDMLFLNHLGSRITRQGFWKLLKKYGQLAGIEEELTPHTLRHSVAAHLLQNGADVYTVQELLGHVDIVSTMKYTTLTKNGVKDVYRHAHPRA
ncbi:MULTISPECIES: site-specific tyrosine recombinase XerD [Paenibacillus]|uniref:site-specific tyrosine recombinase XerD n=1 Tax=Paenibacillus TaxID=44249 RepID=UPI00203FFB5B|nr:site-specific tyrosine recombinase XerD [Paenibacillus camelliae]MCM3633130.1 site-specific tyrosine recombinase XerD [Paenibacillus camelliae]